MLASSPGLLFHYLLCATLKSWERGPGDEAVRYGSSNIIMCTGESIFDESKQQSRKSAKMTLLDEDNSEDLFIPSSVRSGKSAAAEDDEDIFKTEDNSDLLE